jgi:hypothetical protein
MHLWLGTLAAGTHSIRIWNATKSRPPKWRQARHDNQAKSARCSTLLPVAMMNVIPPHCTQLLVDRLQIETYRHIHVHASLGLETRKHDWKLSLRLRKRSFSRYNDGMQAGVRREVLPSAALLSGSSSASIALCWCSLVSPCTVRRRLTG